jgi:hypothetical protein
LTDDEFYVHHMEMLGNNYLAAVMSSYPMIVLVKSDFSDVYRYDLYSDGGNVAT